MLASVSRDSIPMHPPTHHTTHTPRTHATRNATTHHVYYINVHHPPARDTRSRHANPFNMHMRAPHQTPRDIKLSQNERASCISIEHWHQPELHQQQHAVTLIYRIASIIQLTTDRRCLVRNATGRIINLVANHADQLYYNIVSNRSGLN